MYLFLIPSVKSFILMKINMFLDGNNLNDTAWMRSCGVKEGKWSSMLALACLKWITNEFSAEFPCSGKILVWKKKWLETWCPPIVLVPCIRIGQNRCSLLASVLRCLCSLFLIVISDGLSVSGSKARSSTSLKLSEGDSFKLRCSAITTSPEHTHLHVTWQIKSGLSWQDILSLTHEGKFRPGLGYEERYRNGDIRLDTGANDTYQLSVSQASSVDGGVYRCLVSEWVRGADSLWQKIQEKSVEIASVEIQRTGECYWWVGIIASNWSSAASRM